MARPAYRYNPTTCKYEPAYASGKKVFRQTLMFTLISLVVATASFVVYTKNNSSLTELWLEQKNSSLKTEWRIVEKRLQNASRQLAELIEKDDENYRVILDSSPLQSSIREAGTGGSRKITDSEILSNATLFVDYKKLNKLRHQTDIELQSYKQLEKLVKEKQKMWASRPAIQPIDNRQLDKLHLTFGLRMHPIFHALIEHKGLDFAASKGTPIYATGDGKIVKAYTSESYGNVIYLNHGYGFETRYAHLSAFNIKDGEHVKRGQVIGFVGNTGHSVSAHLHYEVLYHDEHINPINFFQRDLNNKEYEKLIQLGSEKADPLD